MNSGWSCPRCGAVYAPWVFQCGRCLPNTYRPPTITPGTPGGPPTITCGGHS